MVVVVVVIVVAFVVVVVVVVVLVVAAVCRGLKHAYSGVCCRAPRWHRMPLQT